MKRNKGKYPQVDKLPKRAKTVREFAEQWDNGGDKERGCTIANVYNTLKRGKNYSFDIVTFREMNFVIPK